jgi:hypothetical protein
MDPSVILALQLAHFTGPNGQDIALNPEQVVTVRPKSKIADDAAHLHGAIRCLIHTTDGKFVGVLEDCDTVQTRLEGAKRGGSP